MAKKVFRAARYGRCMVSCRTLKGWSGLAFFAIEGGSFGFQVAGKILNWWC
ncbi:MAG: hypothetical protein JO266_05795 [Acidobacteria bacterium]|nr:hypothetical protein [Acidobacteriota bacterium]MBV8891479.1 hypothetical protein [Acidobacteriota bacterium]